MKTKVLTLVFLGFLFQNSSIAQNRTTVNATSTEISDNLDLRAVASLFGEASNLEDFERRLNNPQNRISNLDLNSDRQVDYLRVIEVVEQNTHLIILQAVLEPDVFQDVATIEVERDRNNRVQIQVVGNVFMYGPNYIYEPVFVSRPFIYNTFWIQNYNPYCSPYFYNFYPNYFYAWTPYPIYRYRRNVHMHINQYNYYNYSDNRRSVRAVNMYGTRRTNGYERKHPNQSFSTRNTAANRYELDRKNNSGRRKVSSATRNYATNSAANRSNSTPKNSVRTIRKERGATTSAESVQPRNSIQKSSGTVLIRGNRNSNAARQLTRQSDIVINSNNQAATTRNQNKALETQKVERSTRSTRSTPQINNTTRDRKARSEGNTREKSYTRN